MSAQGQAGPQVQSQPQVQPWVLVVLVVSLIVGLQSVQVVGPGSSWPSSLLTHDLRNHYSHHPGHGAVAEVE